MIEIKDFVLIAMILSAVGVLAMAMWLRRQTQALRRYGERTNARFTGWRHRGKNKVAVFKFDVRGEKVTGSGMLGSDGTYSKLTPGDEVAVIYDSAKPRRFMVEGTKNPEILVKILIAAALIDVAAGVVVYMLL